MKNVSTPTACFLALLLAPLSAQAQAQAIQTPQEIQQAAERFVATQLSSAGGAHVTHVTAEPLDARLRLARCAQPLAGALPAAARIGARVTVGVTCTQPRWTVYTPVGVETELPVLVLRNAAARDAHVSAGDVETKTLRVPGLASTYISSVAQLADRHLRLAAAPGTALTVELLVADILVKRGQRVTLVVNAGGFEVRAQGQAVADATAAGRVRILNLGSNKIVEGQVESRDLVRVSL
ncbi:MAG: flagellar basal body P-ring formation chaperone FlgA [Steroidobacteraceae bacterium]